MIRVCTLDLGMRGMLGVDRQGAAARARKAALGALSADELRRARLIRIPGRRTEFLLTRGALRLLLGDAIGVAPDTLVFALGEHGKPYLPDHSGLHFNVSHTAGRALIALTDTGPVGVDVERLDPQLVCEPLAAQVFSTSTRQAIAAVPSERRTGVFFQCWVRGEAILKATGEGLAGAGAGLDVPVGECGRSQIGLAARGVRLQDLPSDGGYAAAVALVGADVPPPFVVVEENSGGCASAALAGLPGGDGAEHTVHEGR